MELQHYQIILKFKDVLQDFWKDNCGSIELHLGSSLNSIQILKIQRNIAKLKQNYKQNANSVGD